MVLQPRQLVERQVRQRRHPGQVREPGIRDLVPGEIQFGQSRQSLEMASPSSPTGNELSAIRSDSSSFPSGEQGPHWRRAVAGQVDALDLVSPGQVGQPHVADRGDARSLILVTRRQPLDMGHSRAGTFSPPRRSTRGRAFPGLRSPVSPTEVLLSHNHFILVSPPRWARPASVIFSQYSRLSDSSCLRSFRWPAPRP